MATKWQSACFNVDLVLIKSLLCIYVVKRVKKKKECYFILTFLKNSDNRQHIRCTQEK